MIAGPVRHPDGQQIAFKRRFKTLRGANRLAVLRRKTISRRGKQFAETAAIAVNILHIAFTVQSLEELERGYGLAYNKDAYIVSYDAFASNIMPNIQVLRKGETQP